MVTVPTIRRELIHDKWGWTDLLIPTDNQEKKRKAFAMLSSPTVPARTAAGGHAGPGRWGPLLVVTLSLALLIGRSRLDRP